MSLTSALELSGVTKSFGRTEIIRSVDLKIGTGERHAIIGPNGAGKSTLFHLISGRLALSGGRIALAGRRIDGVAPHKIRRMGLSRSFQVSNLFGRLSAIENLECALLWQLGYRYSLRRLAGLSDLRGQAWDLLKSLHLEQAAHEPAASLAYAEQRILEIGMTIAGNADVILLDEPTAGMNRGETARMVELIARISQGRTLLMVEHDMGVVFDLATKISVLVHGKVLATGSPAEVRADPAVQEAYLGTKP